MFEVIHCATKESYSVYGISKTEDTWNTLFLIYKDERWDWVFAHNYKPKNQINKG